MNESCTFSKWKSFIDRLAAAEKERDELRAELAALSEALTACAHLLNMPTGSQITDAPKYLSKQMVRAADLAGLTRYKVSATTDGIGRILSVQCGKDRPGTLLLADDVQSLLSKHAGQCVVAGEAGK